MAPVTYEGGMRHILYVENILMHPSDLALPILHILYCDVYLIPDSECVGES